MKPAINFVKGLSIVNKSFDLNTIEADILNYDFKILREKPVFQVDSYSFIFYNANLFVDKIFQGIFFEFCRIAKKSNEKFKFDDFKASYSLEFSEKLLFHSTIDYCLNYTNSVKVKSHSDAELTFPDFYFRLKNKIILFEFKDYLVADNLKNSYEYPKIREYLEKGFFQEGEKAKGTTQLRNQISILSLGGYEFDILKEPYEKIQIYPIIVFTDTTFNCNGVNYIINEAFKKQIDESNFRFQIKDLIMIDFDIFISHQDYFHDYRIGIFDCLDSFYKKVSTSEKSKKFQTIKSVEDATTDFRYFFRSYFNSRFSSYETPKIFQELTKTILGDKNF